jgi:hypothetical protein
METQIIYAALFSSGFLLKTLVDKLRASAQKKRRPPTSLDYLETM